MRSLFQRAIRLAGKLVVAGVIAIATGEVACRIMGYGGGIIYPRGLYVASDNPALAVEFKPEFTGRAYAQPVRINSLGFRGPEIERTPAEGTYRMLAVGDSFTYGMGVAEEEAWPSVLQEMLEPPEGFDRVEVINTGVPGYNLWQGIEVIRTWTPELKPHLIVFALVANDLEPAFYVKDGYLHVPGRTYSWPIPGKRWLQTRSHLYQFLSLRFTQLITARVGYEEMAAPSDPELLRAYRAAREEGVDSLKALLEEFGEPDAPAWYVAEINLPETGVAEVVAESGAPAFPVSLDPDEVLLDGHPDAAGHERMARQIATHVALNLR